MNKLLMPDFGLMLWTVVTFLILAAILAKFAWGPLVGAIEARERRLQEEREASEKARAEAERLKSEFETQMQALAAKTQEMLRQASEQGQRARDEILKDAQEQAKQIAERNRQQLEQERERLVRELRTHVADLTAAASERVLRRAIGREDQERAIREFFEDLDRQGARK